MAWLKRGSGPGTVGLALATLLLIVRRHVLPAPDRTTPAGEADDILGVWADRRGGTEIEIFKRGPLYCARIVALDESIKDGPPRTDARNPDPALRERPLMGLQIISDLAPSEATEGWQGTMYVPHKGKRMNVALRRIGPDTLRVETSRFFFWKTVATWTRTSRLQEALTAAGLQQQNLERISTGEEAFLTPTVPEIAPVYKLDREVGRLYGELAQVRGSIEQGLTRLARLLHLLTPFHDREAERDLLHVQARLEGLQIQIVHAAELVQRLMDPAPEARLRE